MRCTYGLKPPPLPVRLGRRDDFGARVWCRRDVQFCARLRLECRFPPAGSAPPAKARGVQLGNPANLCRQLGGRAKGNAAKTADLLPLILPMKDEGASLRQIADGLNRCDVPAPRGGEWSAVAIKRILDRQV